MIKSPADFRHTELAEHFRFVKGHWIIINNNSDTNFFYGFFIRMCKY